MNWWLFFITALIPLIVGAVYYHPKALGTAWMKSNNFTTQDLDGGNMALIFGLTYVAGLFISGALLPMSIHQMGIVSTLMEAEGFGTEGAEVMTDLKHLADNYWGIGRDFGHGAFHGMLFTIFLIIPVIGILALFERRSLKYVLVHSGYWLISLSLMAGIISQFLHFPVEL